MTLKSLSEMARTYDIVLGSGSPRRVELLRETGIRFSQIVPDLEEDQLPGEEPFVCAERLARDKAEWVAAKLKNGQIAISCDTIVVLNGKVLGKPSDKNDAVAILSELSGKHHTVCTALAIADTRGVRQSGYELTEVFFNQVTEKQIRAYVASGEPMDKAGAYGIQGMGGFLVDRIEGNLDNVIGFPRQLLERLSNLMLTDKGMITN